MCRASAEVRYRFPLMQTMKFLIAAVFIVFSSGAIAQNETSKNFVTHMDEQILSLASPIPASEEFFNHKSEVSLRDDELFGKSARFVATKVHWKFHEGVLRKVSGVMEMKIVLSRATNLDSTRLQGIKESLQTAFDNELKVVGYRGEPVLFQGIEINGKAWLNYRVPILGMLSYSTPLTNERYLTVSFSFIDNAGEPSHLWQNSAVELAKAIISSATIIRN